MFPTDIRDTDGLLSPGYGECLAVEGDLINIPQVRKEAGGHDQEISEQENISSFKHFTLKLYRTFSNQNSLLGGIGDQRVSLTQDVWDKLDSFLHFLAENSIRANFFQIAQVISKFHYWIFSADFLCLPDLSFDEGPGSSNFLHGRGPPGQDFFLSSRWLRRREVEDGLRRQEELCRLVGADVSDLRKEKPEEGTWDQEDPGHQVESVGVLHGLEEEEEDHHGDGEDASHDPLHGRHAGGGEDGDLQELGQSAEAQLDDEDVEADDDGLDQLHCDGGVVHLDVEGWSEELLRQQSYAIKNQLVAFKAPRWFFMA